MTVNQWMAIPQSQREKIRAVLSIIPTGIVQQSSEGTYSDGISQEDLDKYLTVKAINQKLGTAFIDIERAFLELTGEGVYKSVPRLEQTEERDELSPTEFVEDLINNGENNESKSIE